MTLTPVFTIPTMGRALIHHDERSREYGVRGITPTNELKDKTWRRSTPIYDQGRTSSCVGQTFAGMLNTSPQTGAIPLVKRQAYNSGLIYRGAQLRDEWPGEGPNYYGTSALGACRYLKDGGLISEYRWCFGLQDTLMALSHVGPVAIGVVWTQDMMEADSKGYIRARGPEIGGHEVELVGIDTSSRTVIGCQSWGLDWGINGRFRLPWDDLGMLLENQGDAVTILGAR